MKVFKRLLCLLLTLTTVLLVFGACAGDPSNTPGTTAADTTAPATTAPITTEPVTTEPVTTEPVTTEPVTTEPVTTEPVTEAPDPNLPLSEKLASILGKSLNKTFVGDAFITDTGYEVYRYGSANADSFEAACGYFEKEGWSLYCEDGDTNTESKTYTKDDAYVVILFMARRSFVTVTVSQTGAGSLPVQDPDSEKLYPVTVTQPKTEQQGMCEIFHLSDGSFLIFDASGNGAQHAIWDELVALNGGSEENIHIRAWVLTHTHGDHYGGFSSFSAIYASRVKLDTLMYAPVNRDIIKAIDALPNNDWDSIDYSFNKGVLTGTPSLPMICAERFEGAKLCIVHAGQKFSFGGIELRILYTPEHLYMDRIMVDMNNGSIISQVVSEDGKALITGDAGKDCKQWLMNIYRNALASDIFQHPHHGMSQDGDVTLAGWTKAKIVLIPCTIAYHEKNGNANTEKIKNLEHVVATHIMGDGTVTYKLDGTRVK